MSQVRIVAASADYRLGVSANSRMPPEIEGGKGLDAAVRIGGKAGGTAETSSTGSPAVAQPLSRAAVAIS